MLDGLSALPEPQAAAIQGALALGPPAPGDRFAACAGFLGLLSNAAAEQPLLVVVDDAHWLDPASAECVGFAARRLEGLPIALLVAARADEQHAFERRGIDQLPVIGLDRGAARALLKDVDPALPSDVAESLVDAAAGNPLALIELPPQLTPDQRMGLAALDEPLQPGRPPAAGVLPPGLPDFPRGPETPCWSPPPRLRRRSIRSWPPAERLEIEAQAFEPAEAQDIVRLSSERIEFGHPLLRGAVYREAPPPERRRVHRALAEHTDEDSRAWHLAAAALDPDAEVADALEAAAHRGAARGAHAASADALERAARLSEDREARSGACSPPASRPRWAAPTIAASRCWSRPPRSTIPSCAPRYATCSRW